MTGQTITDGGDAYGSFAASLPPPINEYWVGTASSDFMNGYAGNDTLKGVRGNDRITGGTGNDSLFGGKGLDTLWGDDGNDYLDGGFGNDSVFGGAGDDFIVVVTNVTPGLFWSSDVVDGGAGFDTLRIDHRDQWIEYIADFTHASSSKGVGLFSAGHASNIERIIIQSGTGYDRIIGGSGDDIIDGGGGNDTLTGGKGDDTILGGGGRDDLRGGVGDDILDGGRGRDHLMGDADIRALLPGMSDADTLTGGKGADTFVFTIADAALKLGNVDTITDFTHAVDRLEFGHKAFAALTRGALSADNFRIGTNAADATDHLIYDSATGALWYDADGTGAQDAVHIVTLTGAPSLTADDIIIG